MSLLNGKKKAAAAASAACMGCMVMKWLTGFFFLVAAIAALIGAYMAHVTPDGLVFGSTNGSLALIAFVVSMKLLSKQIRCCCPCGGECSVK